MSNSKLSLSDADISEPRMFDTVTLLERAQAFDWLAAELDFATDSAKAPPRVKIEEGVKLLAEESQLVRDKLVTLIKLKSEHKLSTPEYNFNLARLAAVYKLIGIEKREDLPDDVKSAVSAFFDAGRLGTSAVDILASAILLPEENFLNPCIAANHNIRVLAGEFNLPKGAIALRQEVYHSISLGGEKMDDGIKV